MRKMCMLLLALAIALTCAAETVSEPEAWYSLSGDGKSLTVRLTANATTGYEWRHEISDSSRLTLVSAEYIPDENGGRRLGAGGTYAASFECVPEGSGLVSVKFTYARPFETDGSRIVRTLYLLVTEDGRLRVLPWYELSADGRVLTIRLNRTQSDESGDWLLTYSSEALALLTTETIQDTDGEAWTADLAALPSHTGEAFVKIVRVPAGQSDPDETRELKLTIDGDAVLSILCD